MTRPEAPAAVQSTCEAIVRSRGLELVDITLTSSDRGRVLEVILERVDGSVTLDEITEVSEEISRALDVDDPIAGRYTLEVASAGIERPLTKPADYMRFEGRTIKVKTDRPIEARRNFVGQITGSNDDAFVLSIEDGSRVEIPFESVTKSKLVVDWEAELKGAGASRAHQPTGGS